MKTTIEKDEGVYLCTCGASSAKPLCDGAHNAKNEAENARYKPIKVSASESVELDVDSPNY